MRNFATWTIASIACMAILLGGCGRGSSQKPDPILNPPSGGSGGSFLSNGNLNSGMNPDRGPAAGGTPVTIVGTGYVPGQTTVTLNGVPLNNLAVVNSTTITGETPALAAGDDPAATLEIQVNGAVHENENGAFGYIQTLTDPSPSAGDNLGGGTLTVSPNNGTSSNLPGVPLAIADLDANGTPDLAVGAPDKTVSGASSAGQVLIFLSDASGQLPSTPSVVLTQESDALQMSPEAGARFGFSLAIGDINADSALDIIVGAPEATGELLGFNVAGAGEVFAFLGDGTGNFFDFGFDGIADALPLGLLVPGVQLGNPFPATGCKFGFSLSVENLDGGTAGDDILVGAPDDFAVSGSEEGAFFTFGSGNANPEAFTLPFGAGGNGGAAIVAGDMDGDGNGDLIFGGPGFTAASGREGLVAVDSNDASSPFYDQIDLAFTRGTPEAGAEFGASITLADVDGQNGIDIIIGEFARDANGSADSGEVLVLFNDGTGSLVADAVLNGPSFASNDRFGHSVAAGDINGDGSQDIIVGAPGAGSNSGEIHIFLSDGTAQTLTHNETLGETTPESGSSFGFSVAAGDFNGDGFADIVVTSQGTVSGQAGAGEVFLYFTPHP